MKRFVLACMVLFMSVSAVFAQSDLQVLAVIKLNKNESITVKQLKAKYKNIILDIQNYTLSNANNLDINIIKNSGTLEIISGTIHSNAPHGAIDNESSGRLKVSGGQIIATGERQAIYNAGGTVEVTGTAYLSSSASDRATIQNFKPNNANAGTVTISGGTIISTTTTSKGAVQNEATGTVVVTGGSVITVVVIVGSVVTVVVVVTTGSPIETLPASQNFVKLFERFFFAILNPSSEIFTSYSLLCSYFSGKARSAVTSVPSSYVFSDLFDI